MEGREEAEYGGRRGTAGTRRPAAECVAAGVTPTSAGSRTDGAGDASAALVGGVSRYATGDGVRLHYVEVGPAAGPLVVLLHGFPNFWLLWRRHMPAMAAAGLRVVAPDLRGYNLSDKPRGVDAYSVRHLAADVAALVRGCGARGAVVVGHDWGGVVAWRVARSHPDVVRRLAVLNAPHPAAFARQLRTPSQLLRSWYAGFFQLPWLPELALRAYGFAAVERVLRREPARAGAFSDDDVARHRAALDRPGALTAMVNYYRAAARHARGEARAADTTISCPTLVLWGQRDRYLRVQNLDGLERWVPDLRVERFPRATHWLPVEESEIVAERLTAFAREGAD